VRETFVSSDAGFVVEWQLADDADNLIDLAGAESLADRPELATSSGTVPAPR
jgi:hypothetical protein